MEVTFRKASGSGDYAPWIARRHKSRIVGSGLGSDPRGLPHDIVTFLVERELGIDDGFFATVADGGTFRSMVQKRTTYGKSAIARNRHGLDRAEHEVHRVWSAWRAGRPTTCSSVLTSAKKEWMALPPGGEMTLTWPTVGARPARNHSRR
jgi:hypothetical protein